MTDENLDEILIVAKDGPLTRGEWGNLMKQIREEKKYLSFEEHDRLAELGEENPRALTKLQYAQCIESALFRATGVTRDY